MWPNKSLEVTPLADARAHLSVNDESEAYTVYIVSLYEPICEEKSTHSLIPLITEKEDFVANREYLTAWVGAKNYETILNNWNKKV